MSKQIKIEVPKGHHAKFDEQENLITIEPLPTDIRERIKNFKDVLNELGINPDRFAERPLNTSVDDVAYRKLKLIAKALNEGWTPNWENNSELKWYPWFTMGSSSGAGFSFYVAGVRDSDSDAGSRLCFKSRELAEHAAKTFEAIYKEFLT